MRGASLALLALGSPAPGVRGADPMLAAARCPAFVGAGLAGRGTRLVRGTAGAPSLLPLRMAQSATTMSAGTGSQGAKGADAEKASKQKGKKKDDGVYRSTVILPQTDFQQRANAVKREPELQRFWEEERIYEKAVEGNQGGKFVLHDGPPYANGDLHIGHALNKILKDFINRYQILRGRKAHYVPGWDCHGLPIELKVLQSMKSKERAGLTPLDLRRKAAAFAKETVAKQSESFQRYGVWGDWARPYLTLQPEYEAAQLEVFGKMFREGHIYRGRKPVNWSPSSRTALAEAELEYPDDHVSTSVYAAFQVTEPSAALAPFAVAEDGGLWVSVWTTTPWTLPANLAVAVNEELEYSVVRHPKLGDRNLVVAKDLTLTVGQKMGLEEGEQVETLATFKGGDIAGTKYQHPICPRVSEVVIGGDYITTEAGTGLVHTAPGHGQEDYLTGQKYGLPLLSPVDDAGRFTEEAGDRFKGLSVLKEGNEEVIVAMEEAGALLKQEAYPHKYPYDWRTKKPTIFRATSQWFASVDRFRDNALQAIDEVTWIPEVGKKRISSMVTGRSDWCISRQRNWGVPIPVMYHKETGEPLLTAESIEHVRALVAEKGTDAWWELDTAELLPPSERESAEQWQRGTDTMDVWFDSGSSWAGVAGERVGMGYPVDLYLEGSDQHRGWFQSSLLTSVASTGKAPYKTVLTHGFVLDEKGFKMSKSLGNTLDPREVIEGGNNKKQKPAYGADVLRLWVSNVDYAGDVCVGQNIIKQVSDSYRKLRNTCRYLTGNLFDFNPGEDTVPYEDLPSLDKYMLARLSGVMKEVEEAFESYQFYRASQALQRFAVADLSNFYLDTAKDRLYISSPDDPRRRSCQTVLMAMLMDLSKAMAPILPHMAEDVWQTLPFHPPGGHKSIFHSGWVGAGGPALEASEEEKWAKVRLLRDDVNKMLEQARSTKAIGASLEAQAFVHCPDASLRATLEGMRGDQRLLPSPLSTNGVDDLRFVLMVSQVTFVDQPFSPGDSPAEGVSAETTFTLGSEESVSGCTVAVAPAKGDKCERCWYQCESVGTHTDHPTICSRCHGVVQEAGVALQPAAAPAAAAASAAA